MAGVNHTRSDPRTSSARHLRREATPAERRLWQALRLFELSEGHFRRQVPLGPYFADFAHHAARVVIELDGDQHGHMTWLQRDAARTADLEGAGYRVLRFWNHEVLGNLDGVVLTIIAALAEAPPTPHPSPPQAGGGESAPAHLTTAPGSLPC